MRRFVNLADFTADDKLGKTYPIEIPNAYVYERFKVHVNCGTLTGGSSGDFVTDAFLKLIRELRLNLDNLSIPCKPVFQFLLQKYECGTPPRKVSDAEGAFEFWLTASSRERGYGFNASRVKSASLAFDFETIGNLNTGNRTGISGSRIQVVGVIAGSELPNSIWVQDFPRKTPVANAANNELFKLPHGQAYAKIVLVASTDTNGYTRSDGVVNSVTLRNGLNRIYDNTAWNVIQDGDKIDYSLEAVEVGVAILDLENLVMPDPELILDVQGGATSGHVFAFYRAVKPF